MDNIVFVLKDGMELNSDLKNSINNLCDKQEVSFIYFKELEKWHLDKSDLVITLGGDGTFIKAANLLEDSLILGINSNPDLSEGALTLINLNELHKLKEILSGKFSIGLSQRAKITINGKPANIFATNEIYIGCEFQFHSSRYKIIFNGIEEEHRSSGVIVSTGTGSGAWFNSAGGKIFNPDEEKLCFLVREPYLGKRIFKPTILSGEIKKGKKLVLKSMRDFGGIIAVNDWQHSFNKGDVVEIELSDKPLRFVKLS